MSPFLGENSFIASLNFFFRTDIYLAATLQFMSNKSKKCEPIVRQLLHEELKELPVLRPVECNLHV